MTQLNIRVKLKRWLALTAKYLRLESLLVAINRPYLLPRASSYTKPTLKFAKRDGVHFKLDLSDVMQWQVFAKVNTDYGNQVMPYIKNGSIIFDIGANCGEFALKVAQRSLENGYSNIRIYAFEPNPTVIARLNENLSLNSHLKDIVSIVPLALSNVNGKASFSFTERHTGAGRLGEFADCKTIEVKVVLLDDFVKEHSIDLKKVAFIKIDVEGYEANVLEGSVHLFEMCLPVCHLEITDKWLNRNGYSKEFIYNFFEEREYLVQRLTKRGLEPLNDVSFDLTIQHNILCIK